MERLHEDFSKLYKRWKKGEERVEDQVNSELSLTAYIEKYKLRENDYTIHDGGVIDFNCDVNFDSKDDIGFKINKVGGDYNASGIGLEELKCCPNIVEGDFIISDNHLKSFVGCPREVGGNFKATDCHDLESLKGLPKKIGGDFIISTPETPNKFTEDDLPDGIEIGGNIRFGLRRRR